MEAICEKCKKPIENASPLENWKQYHPGCISVEEMIEMSKPKKKLSKKEKVKLFFEQRRAERNEKKEELD